MYRIYLVEKLKWSRKSWQPKLEKDKWAAICKYSVLRNNTPFFVLWPFKFLLLVYGANYQPYIILLDLGELWSLHYGKHEPIYYQHWFANLMCSLGELAWQPLHTGFLENPDNVWCLLVYWRLKSHFFGINFH